MKSQTVLFLLLTLSLAACGTGTRSAPPLSAPPSEVSAETAPKHNIFQEAGDATWRVVTAPVEMVSGMGKKPVKQKPETYDPPDAIFLPRDDDEQAPSSASPASAPASATAAPVSH
jgi:hypothetical protein